MIFPGRANWLERGANPGKLLPEIISVLKRNIIFFFFKPTKKISQMDAQNEFFRREYLVNYFVSGNILGIGYRCFEQH